MDVLRGSHSISSSNGVTSTEEYQQLLSEMKKWKQQADILQGKNEELVKVGRGGIRIKTRR